LFGYVLKQSLVTVFYLTHDEVVLLLACALPFWYGMIAVLQTLSGALAAHVLSPVPARHHQPLSRATDLRPDGCTGAAQATCRAGPRRCATLRPTATRIASTSR
jgi:hypothetical protein